MIFWNNSIFLLNTWQQMYLYQLNETENIFQWIHHLKSVQLLCNMKTVSRLCGYFLLSLVDFCCFATKCPRCLQTALWEMLLSVGLRSGYQLDVFPTKTGTLKLQRPRPSNPFVSWIKVRICLRIQMWPVIMWKQSGLWCRLSQSFPPFLCSLKVKSDISLAACQSCLIWLFLSTVCTKHSLECSLLHITFFECHDWTFACVTKLCRTPQRTTIIIEKCGRKPRQYKSQYNRMCLHWCCFVTPKTSI